MFMCAKLHVCKYMFRIKGQCGIPGLINRVCCYPTKKFDIYTHVICQLRVSPYSANCDRIFFFIVFQR